MRRLHFRLGPGSRIEFRLTKFQRENFGATTTKEGHPFNVDDMLRMSRIEDFAPSPDGRWVVYTKRSWDAKSNKTTTNLWIVSTSSGKTTQLTGGKGQSHTSPAWSRDGATIAFVSNRGGSRQIWTIRVEGGEPKKLSHFPIEVDNLRWSPSGRQIAFSVEVYPDAKRFEETATRDRERGRLPKTMKFDRLPFRHWDKWYEGKRSHIFALPVRYLKEGKRKWILDGPPRDLMKRLDGDCPLRPFGKRDDYSWSPRGEELAFTMKTGDGRAWSTDVDIFLVTTEGGPPRCITGDNRATASHPIYSPDGKNIAYLSMTLPGFESDRRRIKLYDRMSGGTRTLTEAWDCSPDSLAWSLDSKFLLATAQDSARQKIFKISALDGRPSELVSEHHNSSVSVAGNGSVYFTQDSMVAPAEVWTCGSDGTELRRLTHSNDNRMKPVRTSQPEEFYFPGANSERVQAWILKPVGFAPSEKYPVALIIHGGPQGVIEDTFHYRWNLQAFAGAGYAVIAINFHGSVGFGQEFTDSVSGDWGGKPFEDLMKGLDYALQSYPWLDGGRVAALGASYGGWMINWINGHTDRFRCLVNHDGGFDEFASYFTTDELWFPEWEFKGTPWDNPELYDKFSPSRFVANWKTPTLVIHGAKDYRLPDTEGFSTFTALQRRGIPSQLLYFQNEGHWILEPEDSIIWHEAILAWLEKWTGSGRS